jgi:hypothetical protein
MIRRTAKQYKILIFIIISSLTFINSSNAAWCLEEFTFWGDMTLTKNLKSIDPAFEHWFLYEEAWSRRSPETRNLDSILARTGLGYRYSDHITITAGYGYAWQHPVGRATNEDQRPWQQIIFQGNIDKFDLSSRSRLEEIIINKINSPHRKVS